MFYPPFLDRCSPQFYHSANLQPIDMWFLETIKDFDNQSMFLKIFIHYQKKNLNLFLSCGTYFRRKNKAIGGSWLAAISIEIQT